MASANETGSQSLYICRLRLSVTVCRQLNIMAFILTIRYRVIAATICRLVYLKKGSLTLDPAFSLWLVIICTQVEQSLGIITACIPYLKPFLPRISSGMLGNEDIRRRNARDKHHHHAIFGPQYTIKRFFEESRNNHTRNVNDSKITNNGQNHPRSGRSR